VKHESKILYTAGVALLLATLGWTSYRGSPKPAAVTPASVLGAAAPAPGSKPTVGVVFSPRDCSTLIESLRMWNGPSDRGEARVVGLLHGSGNTRAITDKIVRGVGLSFPVRPVDEAKIAGLRGALGHESASFVVVLDGKGQLRLAVPLEELSEPAARARLLATLEPR